MQNYMRTVYSNTSNDFLDISFIIPLSYFTVKSELLYYRSIIFCADIFIAILCFNHISSIGIAQNG